MQMEQIPDHPVIRNMERTGEARGRRMPACHPERRRAAPQSKDLSAPLRFAQDDITGQGG